MKELSLAIDTPEGVVLIVGCSHPTVEKIIEATKSAINKPVHLVLGGTHLLPAKDDQIKTIAASLHDTWKVKFIAPRTARASPPALKQTFGDRYLYAGLGSTLVLGPTVTVKAEVGQPERQAMDAEDLRSYREALAQQGAAVRRCSAATRGWRVPPAERIRHERDLARVSGSGLRICWWFDRACQADDEIVASRPGAARARRSELRIGTSGWHYASVGSVLSGGPEEEGRAALLCVAVATELNAPFYRTPTPEAVQSWFDGTPDGFRFTWKASRFITHWKRLSDHSANSLELMETRLAPLRHKLGPICSSRRAWPPIASVSPRSSGC